MKNFITNLIQYVPVFQLIHHKFQCFWKYYCVPSLGIESLLLWVPQQSSRRLSHKKYQCHYLVSYSCQILELKDAYKMKQYQNFFHKKISFYNYEDNLNKNILECDWKSWNNNNSNYSIFNLILKNINSFDTNVFSTILS